MLEYRAAWGGEEGGEKEEGQGEGGGEGFLDLLSQSNPAPEAG